MSDVDGALMTALIAKLDTELTPTKAYTRAPESAAMPYVTVDATMATDASTISRIRDDTKVYLTVWSNRGGTKEVNEKIAAIHDALHRQKLTLTDGTMVQAIVIARGTEPDIEEEIHKGLVTLRFLINH